METILQNMCMIYDRDNDKILILDKVKKYGWEGLTFVGGHVEKGEVLYDSCVREVFEETGLTVENLKLKGTVSWIDEINDKRELGFLYYTEDFSGELIENNVFEAFSDRKGAAGARVFRIRIARFVRGGRIFYDIRGSRTQQHQTCCRCDQK